MKPDFRRISRGVWEWEFSRGFVYRITALRDIHGEFWGYLFQAVNRMASDYTSHTDIPDKQRGSRHWRHFSECVNHVASYWVPQTPIFDSFKP